MKIVIDIKEEMYKRLCEAKQSCADEGTMLVAIANGQVLPKGHGDLIDRDYFIDKYAGCGSVYCEDISCNECNSRIVSKFDVDNAPIVIPADNRRLKNEY